jgi:hypothetical protein
MRLASRGAGYELCLVVICHGRLANSSLQRTTWTALALECTAVCVVLEQWRYLSILMGNGVYRQYDAFIIIVESWSNQTSHDFTS